MTVITQSSGLLEVKNSAERHNLSRHPFSKSKQQYSRDITVGWPQERSSHCSALCNFKKFYKGLYCGWHTHWVAVIYFLSHIIVDQIPMLRYFLQTFQPSPNLEVRTWFSFFNLPHNPRHLFFTLTWVLIFLCPREKHYLENIPPDLGLLIAMPLKAPWISSNGSAYGQGWGQNGVLTVLLLSGSRYDTEECGISKVARYMSWNFHLHTLFLNYLLILANSFSIINNEEIDHDGVIVVI